MTGKETLDFIVEHSRPSSPERELLLQYEAACAIEAGLQLVRSNISRFVDADVTLDAHVLTDMTLGGVTLRAFFQLRVDKLVGEGERKKLDRLIQKEMRREVRVVR